MYIPEIKIVRMLANELLNSIESDASPVRDAILYRPYKNQTASEF